MNGMNGIEIETLMNTKKCHSCGNNKPAIGNQRKNGKNFQAQSNNSNDWKARKYCKKCNKSISESRMNCFDTWSMTFETEEEEKSYIAQNIKQHESYLQYKVNKLQEQIDQRNEKKASKKKKPVKAN